MKVRRKASPRGDVAELPYDPQLDEELERRELDAEVMRAHMRRLEICRENVDEFCAYVGRDAETNLPIVQEPIHEEFQALADFFPRLILMSFPESGKAVPLDTKIPTPTGWRTMGDLEPGDEVFGRDGDPCRVTWTSPVQFGRTVYEIEFDDGVKVRADADHRWLVRDAKKRYRTKELVVKTTREILEEGLVTHDRSRWLVPVAAPVQYPTRDLPVHPYALGAWLGDGTSENAAITFADQDRFIWERCRALEGGDSPQPNKANPNVWTGTIGSRGGGKNKFRRALRSLGLKDRKRIPAIYLTASEAQRRELLAGLLDTDGHACKDTAQIELSLSDEDLARDSIELIRSLGYKAHWNPDVSTLYGRVVGMRYRIRFTARDPVFHLPRKLASQKLGWLDNRARWRAIVGVRDVPTVPVKCIAVDSPDRTYLMGESYTVTHNTSQLAILRLIWALGRNPNIRISIVSKIQDKAIQITRAIKSYIEKSKELAEVFPNLLPGDSWADNAFIVRRPVHSRDPSVQALGLYDAVTGSRIDILVFDDVIDAENTSTPEGRRKVLKRIRGTFIDRVSKTGRILFLTNAWHPEDPAHTLEKEGWHCARYVSVDEDGVLTWEEKWNEERLAQARLDMGPLEFARAHLCRARDEGESPFDEEAIDKCVKGAADLELVHALNPDELPPGAIAITGVDLAITASTSGKTKSAETALVTILLWPDDLSRQLLWVEAGRWSSREIRDRILDHDRRYNGVFVVENNAAQAWIFDIIRNQLDLPEEERRLPTLVPFTTGSNKAHAQFGVEGVAVEMSAGDWLIPTSGLGKAVEEVKKLLSEIRYYTRGSHTGDRLMGLWFAREYARRGSKAGKTEKEEGRDLTPDFGGIGATVVGEGVVTADSIIEFG